MKQLFTLSKTELEATLQTEMLLATEKKNYKQVKKVALLQQKWDGEVDEKDDVETGEWSSENLAKNRQRILEKEAPWVLKNMSCSDYYDQYIKPTQEAKAA
jgi:hypothetical protein